MNTATKELLSFFLNRFPGTDEVLFKMLVEAWLAGNRIDETWKNLSSETSENLRSLFSSLTEESIREWAFGLLMQNAGNNQNRCSDKTKDKRF